LIQNKTKPTESTVASRPVSKGELIHGKFMNTYTTQAVHSCLEDYWKFHALGCRTKKLKRPDDWLFFRLDNV
jgi:hypothetical protein